MFACVFVFAVLLPITIVSAHATTSSLANLADAINSPSIYTDRDSALTSGEFPFFTGTQYTTRNSAPTSQPAARTFLYTVISYAIDVRLVIINYTDVASV